MKYVLISVVIVIVGLTGFLNPVKEAILGFVAPVQFGMRKTAVLHRDMIKFFSTANNVREENLSLLKKVGELEQQTANIKLLEDENKLLREQLKVSLERSNTTVVAMAAVMGNPSDSTGGTILIDKGTGDGVRINDTVVVGNNVVGLVKSVEDSRSLVELINSSSMQFTVYDLSSSDKTQGLACGEHGSSVTIDRILPSEKISVGDTVVTSGKSGLFCSGLVVGKISEIIADPSQPLVKAKLEPLLDFSRLSQVFVIRSD